MKYRFEKQVSECFHQTFLMQSVRLMMETRLRRPRDSAGGDGDAVRAERPASVPSGRDHIHHFDRYVSNLGAEAVSFSPGPFVS